MVSLPQGMNHPLLGTNPCVITSLHFSRWRRLKTDSRKEQLWPPFWRARTLHLQAREATQRASFHSTSRFAPVPMASITTQGMKKCNLSADSSMECRYRRKCCQVSGKPPYWSAGGAVALRLERSTVFIVGIMSHCGIFGLPSDFMEGIHGSTQQGWLICGRFSPGRLGIASPRRPWRCRKGDRECRFRLRGV